ncbi:MAG: ATP-binding protein [Clostridiales bacterium]|nr:ATP-binding protein [Clostridiales bacterium]
MDIHELRELMLDLNCMTALRHVMRNPAIAALNALLQLCAQDDADPDALTQGYCDVYDAWLSAAAKGRGGFAREALEAVLFDESPAAALCARLDASELPYSLMNALAHDLEALGRLTAIEPAMLLLLCERAGMEGKTAARLPMWEPAMSAEPLDPRMDRAMLTREGARRVAAFFRRHGSGLFAQYPGSTWVGVSERYPLGLRGVREPDPIRLEDMVLYEKERGILVENTQRLLSGRQACNILLYGDKGTGKSATVKALLSSFWLEGLRIVEVPLAHLTNLPAIFSILREQPGKFIVFVDDLAFNDSCPEYTALKTVLEGGLEARPANVVVYATSNRRNIVRQRFSERQDDVNERDTLEEKYSLADRFDLRLTFSAPTQEEYFTIVRALLDARGIEYDWETLMPRARAWTVSHSGCSPRIARQFADLVAGEQAGEPQQAQEPGAQEQTE